MCQAGLAEVNLVVNHAGQQMKAGRNDHFVHGDLRCGIDDSDAGAVYIKVTPKTFISWDCALLLLRSLGSFQEDRQILQAFLPERREFRHRPPTSPHGAATLVGHDREELEQLRPAEIYPAVGKTIGVAPRL